MKFKILTAFYLVLGAQAFSAMSCKYEYPPAIFWPSGSNACGETTKTGPYICGGRVNCFDGRNNHFFVGVCDALPDGTCPSADLCQEDSAHTGIGKAQIAKDSAVKEFWQKRDALAERSRKQKANNPRDASGLHTKQATVSK